VPLDCVNLERRTITFRIKGNRSHTTQLHPALVPLFQRLKAEGRTHSFNFPGKGNEAGDGGSYTSYWRRFFDSLGLHHICFHCTRVTVVTQLARSGVNEQTARRFVGHSSKLVHQIYTRLSHDDLGAAVAAIPSSDTPPEP